MDTQEKLRDYLKRATADLHQARLRIRELEAEAAEPVAIVGMACRFPGGVRSAEDLWRLAESGGDAIGPLPGDRGWDQAVLQHPDSSRPGATYVRAGGFLPDAGDFDAEFFGISPREALAMDPQQRLLLETAWEAVERAGIGPQTLRGSQTGVYVGVMGSDYGPRPHRAPGDVEGYLVTGTSTSVASGRIAYTLGLEGPAVTVDTACSSSLVALHCAVQAVRRGECAMALAGGATVMAEPGVLVDLGRQRGLAADGRCKPFAAAADGFGASEGVGLILVERLSEARRLGHRVLAVIRGSAVNQDGASNGLTAPNGPSQQRVIRAALAAAGLAPDEVDVVEAHGTGTELGDPIEAQALAAVYGPTRDAGRPLLVGSVKSNIGHTQAAAGVAGVIKTVMAMRHGVLPPTLNVDELSQHIDWTSGTLRVVTEADAWPETGRPRRAGVSSFGISGTNAHVILEEAPESTELPDSGRSGALSPFEGLDVVPWVVSGRGAEALRKQAERLAGYTGSQSPDTLTVASALVTSRSVFEDRAVVFGSEGLEALAAGVESPDAVVGSKVGGTGPVFVFPGQGSQWVGMAAELTAASPVFAASMERCAEALSPYADILSSDADIERVDVIQPLLWAVHVSLAALWRSVGVEPAAVVGHSQGEIAAAVVAGALSLEDGARVVALRSKAITRLAGTGGMVSVFAGADQVEELLPPEVSVAAVNGPESVVVSGTVAGLDDFLARCESEGVQARRVAVDYASHSAMVEDLETEIVEALAGVTSQAPSVPMFSTSTADWVGDGQLDGRYWYENLRNRVRFADAVSTLTSAGHRVFIESSAHPVLISSLPDDTAALGTLRRGEGGARRFLTSAAQAFVYGAVVDWSAVLPPDLAQTPLDLPTYAFQRERFWLAAEDEDFGSRDAATLDSYRYRAAWRPVADLDSGRLRGRWLLVRPAGDAIEPGLADTVAAGLSARGAQVTVLELAPDVAADRERLAASLTAAFEGFEAFEASEDSGSGTSAAGVLSLLALDAAVLDGDPQLRRGVAASLTLIQALGDAGSEAPLWCLTRGAVAAEADDAVPDARQALLWGLGRTAALEYPDRWGGLIDLPEVFDDRAADRLGAALAGVRADRSQAVDEDQIVIRPSGLLARRVVRAPLGDPRPARAWRPHGTVLVTGATGAVGPHLVRWLAAAGAERLVLAGRRADSPGFDALRATAAAAGAQLVIESCDVADRDRLAELIARVEAGGSAITGVVHAAVHTLLTPLDQVDAAEFAATTAAKCAGADHLDALLDRDSVEAFVLFSSIAGMWGSGDHGTYAAANAYLDAVAARRRARGRHALCVAWGVWEGAMPPGIDQTRPARHGLPGVEPRLALAGLQEALDHDETSVAVAKVEWPRFTEVFTSGRPSPLFGEIGEIGEIGETSGIGGIGAAARPTAEAAAGAAPVDGGLATRLAGRSPAERIKTLLELVQREAAAVLGRRPAEPGRSGHSDHADQSDQSDHSDHADRSDQSGEPGGPGRSGPVRAERAFRDSGLDSLTAVELRNRLAAATGLRLPAALVFSHPTPQALATHLNTLLAPPAAADSASTAAPDAGTGVVAPRSGPSSDDDAEPLAIVGMACRFPGGVRSPEDLWDLVAAGGDAISGFPVNRGWDLDALYHPDPDRDGACYVRHGGFLHDAGRFDAGFFGISPREALAMDPQQRLLLETSWEAIERAGIVPDALRGSRTGVYVGVNYQEYGSGLRAAPAGSEGHLLTGSVSSVVSGRVAYTLGLEGPAITLDTACSSSLVALHLAGRALRTGECDAALVGGVAVMYSPRVLVAFSRQRGLAADGRCKAFAESADGMGLAEGAAMVLVERLADARRLGHPVLAVVRGSAINQDGASNGLSAPSGPAQERVIREALAAAGVPADGVDVVEAHGTGTRLGDPVEAGALLATYGRNRPAGRPLLLGSLKSNIGHTQAASGAASLVKMVMALRQGVVPPTLHVDTPSSHVDWEAGAVELVTEGRAWPAVDRPRRAGVSSFGISGTNAHVILEQAPEPAPAPTADHAPETTGGPDSGRSRTLPPFEGLEVLPWVVSGRGAGALRGQAERLAAFVAPEADPAAVASALVTSRSLFEDRAVMFGSEGLAAVASGVESAYAVVGSTVGSTGPVFVFPGQGSQWVGMAAELIAVSPVFAASMERCAAALSPYVDILSSDADVERVDVIQPLLWAMHVSLAALWRSVGVEPAAVVGHSQGEIAAAVVAGALSLEDGARVVALRSRAITKIAGTGGMVSVFAGAERVEGLLPPEVSVAAVNGPESVVVSGTVAGLDEFLARCESEGLQARRVAVDYASHSAMVEDLETEIVEALAGVTSHTPAVPMFSTLTGDWITHHQLDGRYWHENLRNPVRFADAVSALTQAGHRVFIESSAHPVLTGGVQDALDDAAEGGVALGTLRRGEGGPARFLASAAEAFVHGVAVDWPAVVPADPAAPRVDLPTYAFQQRDYWILDDPRSPAAPARPVTDEAAAWDDADREFWQTVDDGDVSGLAGLLEAGGVGSGVGGAGGVGVDSSVGVGEAGGVPWSDLLRALSRWRRERRDAAATARWRYRVRWRPVADAAEPALDGTWIVVVPAGTRDGAPQEAPVSAPTPPDWIRTLRDAGAKLIEIEHSDSRSRAEYVSLLRDAGAVEGVLSLLALAPRDGDPAVPAFLPATLDLVHALAESGVAAPLWLATAGAVAAGPADEPADAGQAQLWGLGRVVGLEYPGWGGGLIDLPVRPDAAAAGRLRAVLTGRLGAEDQLAVRESGILARRLVRAAAPAGPGPAGWRPAGTVLVTGGTGALGGHVARWLAGSGASRLVLVSRAGERAPGAGELRAELAARGVPVLIEACDIADRAAFAALVARVEADGEPVRAVFHAAGVGVPTPLPETRHADLAACAAPKVDGTLAIEAVLGDRLDAFVLFSSNAAVWGSTGLAAYAAANAFLDTFAENRRRDGRPVTSVAWGLWDGEGMSAGAPAELMVRRGVRPMAPERAVLALRQALESGDGALAVADLDWPLFHQAFTFARPRPLLSEIDEVAALAAAEAGLDARDVRQSAGTEAGAAGDDTGSEPGTALRQRLSALPRPERPRALAELVRAQAAAVLNLDSAQDVPADRAFRDLGFDSLTAVEARRRIAAATGLRLPATLVFDHPTPTALARHLAELLFPASGSAGSATGPEPGTTNAQDATDGIDTTDAPRLRGADIDSLDAESLIRLALDPAS